MRSMDPLRIYSDPIGKPEDQISNLRLLGSQQNFRTQDGELQAVNLPPIDIQTIDLADDFDFITLAGPSTSKAIKFPSRLFQQVWDNISKRNHSLSDHESVQTACCTLGTEIAAAKIEEGQFEDPISLVMIYLNPLSNPSYYIRKIGEKIYSKQSLDSFSQL